MLDNDAPGTSAKSDALGNGVAGAVQSTYDVALFIFTVKWPFVSSPPVIAPPDAEMLASRLVSAPAHGELCRRRREPVAIGTKTA